MKKKNKDFSVDAAEDSPGFLLWQVTTLWQRGIKKELDKTGITHPQFVLLASLLWLSGQHDSVTQINLSTHSKIDPMTTSAIIKILQRKNLIERAEHHADTRAKKVALTPEGLKTTRQAIKIIEKYDARFFSPLGKKERNFIVRLQTLSGQTVANKNDPDK